MILNVKDFQNNCKTILVAVDNSNQKAANLELITKDKVLELNVTNTEYYVSVKFDLPEAEKFHAVVQAQRFLELIAGLTVEEIDLSIDGNSVKVTAGKTSYKLPMIFENSELMDLPAIILYNKTIEMPISKDILYSILNANSKELTKLSKDDKSQLSEWQKGYYITDEGCLTFTTGSCLNTFKLEKPVKMILNERIVKLFKLFNNDVKFSLANDALSNTAIQTKVSFEADNIYLAAIISNDEVYLNKFQGPYDRTKLFINDNYPNKAVLSVKALSGAITRLLAFSKSEIQIKGLFSALFTIENNELIIKDSFDNSEAIAIENNSISDGDYKMLLNLFDIKLVLDACKEEFVTVNFGNHTAIVITRGNICNLIPELQQK